ncbi:MAG: HAD hydrolase-like protein [Acidimicrobiia bacterium]|nr:HAD hydrolase-like protein [Acidimicrobiia bacterium]
MNESNLYSGFQTLINRPKQKSKPIIIWDLDGTIIDDSLYRTCAQNVFQKIFGIKITDEEYNIYFENQNYCHHTTKQFLLNNNIDPKDIPALEEVFDAIDQHFRDLLTSGLIQTLGNAVELISELHRQGYRQCLVTGSCRETVDEVLLKLVPNFFELIIARKDTFWQKPNSQPYEKCYKSINADPSDCVIIENSQQGVSSARNSGAYVIACSDNQEMGETLRTFGAHCVTSLSQLTPELISLFWETFDHNRQSIAPVMHTL